MAAQATARARVQLGIHLNVDDSFSCVASGQLPEDAPFDASALNAWIEDGWSLDSVPHGNGDRGAVLVLRKGTLVNLEQVLLGLEKDGKGFCVCARQRLTPGLSYPDGWRDLDSWLADGWRFADMTGNLEHSGFFVFSRRTDDPTDALAPAA